MDERKRWVDVAKGIGILLVVYGHVARGVNKTSVDFEYEYFLPLDNFVYLFHMPLFFFLSGLFFLKVLEAKGGKGTVYSKIDTIVYPYLVWSVLQGSIEVALASWTNGNASLLDVLHVFWDPRAQFWFLYTLFVIFVFFVFLRRFLGGAFLMSSLLISVCLYFGSTWVPDFWVFKFVAENMIFFCLAIVLSTTDWEKKIALPLFMPISLMFFVCINLYINFFEFHGYKEKGIEVLIAAIVSIIFIASLSVRADGVISYFLAYLGRNSMGIYLMHILAGAAVRIFLLKVLSIDDLYAHLALGVLGGVLFPLAAIAFINRFDIRYVFMAPLSKVFRGGFRREM